jgi:HepT-like protein
VSDGRWFDVDADIRAAVEHFERSVELDREGGFDAPGLAGYKAEMALMHSLQSGDTSLEGALVRILKMVGEEPPVGETWHADLIRRVAAAIPGARPAILSQAVAQAADETRRFRHIAIHNYDNFRYDVAGPTIRAAKLLAGRLTEEISAFKATIDPPGGGR